MMSSVRSGAGVCCEAGTFRYHAGPDDAGNGMISKPERYTMTGLFQETLFDMGQEV